MMKFEHFGWVVAAGIGGWLLSSGFQAPPTKIGVVDVGKVFNDSDYAKAQATSMQQIVDARSAMLEFVKNYRLFTPEQASAFKELSTKDNATPAEKTQLEKIKADVQAAAKAFTDLQTKKNPTPDDTAKMSAYTLEVQTMSTTSLRWAQGFDDEVRTLNDKLRNETLQRVRDAVKVVGVKQGYYMMFSNDIAPYGAIDATDDTLKAVNAKK